MGILLISYDLEEWWNYALSGHKLMCPFHYLDLFVCFHQSVRRTRNFPWQHDLFEESLRAAGIPGIEIGTKLYVSNLDSGVTNEDIRVWFKPYVFILSAFFRGFFLKFTWSLMCNSGTLCWDWGPEKICSSLWQKWSPKCKYLCLVLVTSIIFLMPILFSS